jgi:hypothetical protein
MTKAQAFAVVGTPMRATTNDEAGKKVEIWFPRQDTGTWGDNRKVVSASTGFPAELRQIGSHRADGQAGEGERRLAAVAIPMAILGCCFLCYRSSS